MRILDWWRQRQKRRARSEWDNPQGRDLLADMITDKKDKEPLW